QMITQSGSNLKNLVSDILDLSKMQSGRGKQAFKISQVSIDKIIDKVKPAVAGLVINKDVKLIFDIQDNLDKVYVDIDKIRQVLINIIGNAVKFTDKGHVKVNVKPYKEEGYVLVSVTDTGIGMKNKDLKVIFDEFRQADGSATRQYEGTGLGLAISKKIIEAHKGKIWAESELGKGSTFNFTLSTIPIEQVQEVIEKSDDEFFERRKEDKDFNASSRGFVADKEEHKDKLIKFPKGDGENLLIVDDIDINLEALALNLKDKGYNVSKAISANEAIDLLKSSDYDLIISDVMMPVMDGYQLVEEIRASDNQEEIPIILLTAKTRLEDKKKGFEAGADDYMVKPFEIGELLLRIKKSLNRDIKISTDDKKYDVTKSEKYNILNKGKDEIILAIDDNPTNLEVLKVRLEMNNWKVVQALSGEQGVEMYKELKPDLVLLDIMMPGMNGFEVCKKIRDQLEDDLTPIIFLTAKQQNVDKIYGVNVGGSDYITKPFDKDELVIRIANHLSSYKMMLEIKDTELLKRDIQIAGNIQRKLMPSSFPENNAVEFYGGTQAATDVGGDYFDIIDVGDGKYLCAIADVTGHGIAASLVMVKIQTLLKTLVYKENIDVWSMLEDINKYLFEDIKRAKLATVCLVLFDSNTGELKYANAGHEPVYIYNIKKKSITELKEKCFLLGVTQELIGVDKTKIKLNKIKLNKDDMFILYTDGITEAMDTDKNLFGTARFKKMLEKYSNKSVMTIYKLIMDEVAEHTKNVSHQMDDMTLVIGKVK
ncbi:MAG: response regulator, partial [Spirochaetes bacterium]|nr:response regulator [Spirochaetota bacterium]